MPTKEWTEGRKKSFLTSVLRGGFRRWPSKFEVLKEAAVGKKLNEKTKREAMHYACASCEKTFPQKEVQVDHRVPVVDPVKGFIDWNTFIERLYCPKENLQVLCKECHLIKTKEEKKRKGKLLSLSTKK